MTDLTPEARLVLACARAAPGPDHLARIAALAQGPIDWDTALHLGMRHGLAPLMHRHLSGTQALPKSVEAALWARAQSVAHRNRAMAVELAAIAVALDERGVRFAPFKGPLLAAAVKCAATREYGDLDILVASADVPAARAVLAARGYAPRTPLDPVREKLWIESPGRHEFPLEDAQRGFIVELQWRANPEVPVPALDDARWWTEAPVIRFDAIEVRTVPDDEQMLALLVHGAKHHWGSLDWLVDISELARAGRVPWEAVMRLAKEHGATRRAAVGLELAHRLLEAPLPATVRAFVASAGVEDIARRLVGPALATDFVPPSMAEALRVELALCDTPWQRIARLAQSLRPTPGDWEWCRLPRGWTFLYWVIRPVRLAVKYLFKARSRQTPPAATPRTPPPRPRSTG